MAAPKTFSNVIIGQFVLTGVPVKVYASGQFLTITDADDVEDPIIGFGMNEDGDMIQFSYPEVEFLQVVGNRIDIATYNKGMEALHSGDETPADAESEEESEEESEDEEGEEEEKEAPAGPSMSDGYIPEMSSLVEISKDVYKAKMDVIKQQEKELKDKASALKKEPIEDGVIEEDHYTFGTGDIVNNKNTNCTHYGSKGIVIQIPQTGYVRYSVTNSGDTYKPGDILTKTSDQLEKI